MTVAWIPPLLGNGLEGETLWNAVVALGGQPLPLEGGASFAFALSSAPPADAWVARVRAEGVPLPFLVHVRDFPFRALFDVDLAVGDLPGLPDGLRQAMFEGMFETVRGLVAAEQGTRLTLDGQGLLSAFADFAGSEIQWFDVRLTRADGAVVDLDVACDRSVAIRFVPASMPSQAPARTALADRVLLPVDMTIGSIIVARRELQSIEPGAVIVLADQPPGTLKLRARDAMFDFANMQDGWHCTSVSSIERHRATPTLHRTGGQAMNDETSAAGADPELSAADLRVAIDFDIGRSQIPLSVLTQWQPGTVVNLDPPPVGNGLEVTIRANGDIVGSGDVVRIDDRIAVRITRFLLRP